MMDYFDQAMDSSYASLKERQYQDAGENLAKTYILELHNPRKDRVLFGNFLDFISNQSFSVEEMGDSSLYKVMKGEAVYFFDAIDPRFFLIHSPSKAQLCNEDIGELIKAYPRLDRTWFNSDLLESLSYYGDFESWKSTFNSKKIFTKTDLSMHEDLNWEELNLTVKTRDSRGKLDMIRKTQIFSDMLPITGMRIRRDSGDESFAREDITYNGKFTARGNNFTDHLDVVTEFSRGYSRLIDSIEDDCALHFEKGAGLSGEPIVFEFQPIEQEHFKVLINNWFGGTQPFLLWGHIEYRHDDYALIDAIDLHIGHRLSFEISLGWMRVYLPSNACGNTVARLITNLQQHFRSSIRVQNKTLQEAMSFRKYE